MDEAYTTFSTEAEDISASALTESELAFPSFTEAEDISASTLTESELAFPSLIDESENIEEEFISSETDDAIASVFGEISNIQEDLAEVQSSFASDSFSSAFDLPDLSNMEETDDALMNEMFDFGISNEADNFGAPINSLEEESPITFDELMLNESEADLSSVFSDNLEQGTELSLSYQEFISNSEDNIDLDENTSTFSDLTGGLESDDESIKFSELMDAENFADNALVLEDSIVFEAIADGANDLDVESSGDSLDFDISEASSFGIDSEFTESMPDLSLDLSDSWLDAVTEDRDVNRAKFTDSDDDLSIGYPDEDEVSAASDGDIYGFADNLLESLMDESDEEFENLSMDLPDLQTLPHLPNLNNDSLEAEDRNIELESEHEFDFSAFDLPIEDSINTARAEIDDFLSGNLDIEEEKIEKKIPPKKVEPDNLGSV